MWAQMYQGNQKLRNLHTISSLVLKQSGTAADTVS